MEDTDTPPVTVVETEQAQPVEVEPVKVVKKSAKVAEPKANAVEDYATIDAYRKLKKAAQNVLDLYGQRHTVKGVEDYKFPGLRDLAEVLRS